MAGTLMIDLQRAVRIAFGALVVATFIDSPAFDEMPGIAAVPTYCDVGGRLSMENCSLVNMVLAEEFLNAVLLNRPEGKSQDPRRDVLEIDKKCGKARTRSQAQSGRGTLNDVVERECRADEFHAAAMQALGLRGRRETIPYDSTRLPTYCTHEDGNRFGCMYINRLIAIDFFRRATAARESPASQTSTTPITLEEIESTCSASPPNAAGSSAETQQLEQLKCVRNRLHEAALQLLR